MILSHITTMKMNSVRFVSIEGNIGSGKSTLLSKLQDEFKDNALIVFLKEPVDEWEQIKDEQGNTMLQKFYEDQTKYSFSFQMMAFISRFNIFKQAILENPKAIIFVTERSLDTDRYVFTQMLYDSGKIESVNYQIYLKWVTTFSHEFPINQVIYVKTTPEICHYRIAKRSRNGENVIPLEYLTECNKYHANMMAKYENQLILDGNMDIFENEDQLVSWVDLITQFIL